LKKEAVKALREWKRTKIDGNWFLEAKRRYREREREREKCRKIKKQKEEGGQRDKGNKNREGSMEMHKL
jgi:hypothetical protein